MAGGESIAIGKIREICRAISQLPLSNFDTFMNKPFYSTNMPRLYAMHKVIWQELPDLGLHNLYLTLRHLMSFWVWKPNLDSIYTPTNNYISSHLIVCMALYTL